MDWSQLYPTFVSPKEEGKSETGIARSQGLTGKKMITGVEIADIGCGFGGLLVALAPLFPNTLLLGKSYQPVRSLVTSPY